MARQVQNAVIASGQSLSGVVDVGSEYTLVGVAVPAAWTSASITFQAAAHTGNTAPTAFGESPQDKLEALLTFQTLKDAAGAEITLVAGAGDTFIAIPDYLLEGVQFLKVRSGTSAAPVVQAADRTLRLVVAE